jgi:hypothetical protein
VEDGYERVCKLCDEKAALVQSHVIPRAFFDAKGSEPLKLISNIEGRYPRRSPIGVYDRIVCNACEKGFANYDSYAAKILLQSIGEYQRVEYRGELIALRGPKIDYRLLKLFAISVLWRAAVASHDFYNRVQLGPFEARAKEMLRSRDPGDSEEFAVWWAVFDIESPPAIMDPFRERYEGVTTYRIYFGKVVGYIKVDRRPTPDPFKDLTLAPDRDLIFVGRDYENSKDREVMRKVLLTALRGNSTLFK